MASQHNAKLFESEYPRASETVLKSTYMDDSMDSVDNDKQAVELYEELTELWGKAGMVAHKWMSNSKTVMEHIPVDDRASKVDLAKDELPKIKTLGVLWEAENDNFKFDINLVDVHKPMTKREYLKKIATMFDPLGLLAPYILRGKMIMQDIWLSGVEWDQCIETETLIKIAHLFDELPKIKQITVPRCIKGDKPVKEMTIHAFSDASVRAYGAVVYSRNEHEDGDVSVRMIAAKSKVAPMAAISIPRLELMAAILNLELTMAVKDALEFDIEKCTFWTDSMDVICWLRNQSRVFKPFVANRVAEIQRTTNPSQWRHVPGESNPADLVSRGVKIDQLIEEQFWWEGPNFLKESEMEWPRTTVKGKMTDQSEVKKTETERFKRVDKNYNVSCVDSVKNDKTEMWRLDPLRYSSWERLKRVMAWVLRFIENCIEKQNLRKLGELTCDELKESEERLIREAQKKEFSEYKDILRGKSLSKNSKLLPLNPVVDTEGIVRSNSRLQYAEFISFECRHPIILPRYSWITNS